jgi:hypothetical protein
MSISNYFKASLSEFLGIEEIIMAKFKEQEKKIQERLSGIETGFGILKEELEKHMERMGAIEKEYAEVDFEDENARMEGVMRGIDVMVAALRGPVEPGEPTEPEVPVDQQVNDAINGSEETGAPSEVDDSGEVEDIGTPQGDVAEGTVGEVTPTGSTDVGSADTETATGTEADNPNPGGSADTGTDTATGTAADVDTGTDANSDGNTFMP